ncbi:MAG: Ig-like domain-containing protein [Syntrophomonas sp.]
MVYNSGYSQPGIHRQCHRTSVTVKFDQKTLTRDVDYTVSYAENTAAGTATVTIAGKGLYTESKTKTFQISEKVACFTLSYYNTSETIANLIATADINELPPGTLTFKSGDTVIASGVAFIYENSIYTAATTWNDIPPGTNTVTAEYVPGTNDGYSLYQKAPFSFCLCKWVPSGFSFASGTINKTCGDSTFTVTASGGPGTGAVTYKSSDTNIATIGESTGLVTILKPGTIKLTATQAEDDQYASVFSEAELIIAEPDKTAPTLSAASCSEVTPSGATVNFTSDEAGTYYYLVRLATEAAPTDAEVKNSGNTGTANANADNSITLSVLSASTEYTVYIVETDKYLNQSNRLSVSFTPDNTAPTLSLVSVSDVSASGAAVTFTSDEAGTYYCLAVSATFVPTVLQVQNYGTSGNAIAGSGNNISVTGLSDSTEYTVYVVQTDAAGNLSDLYSVSFSTSEGADQTAPRLSWISSNGVSSSGATVTFTSDEAGTYYYLACPSTLTAPTTAEVKKSGTSGTAKAGSGNNITITGLSASTEYTVYIAETDAAGNLSSLESVSFSTSAAPYEPPPWYSVTGVTMDKSSLSMQVNDLPVKLMATVEPSYASNPYCIWSSSDSSVASVDAYGMVTPASPGQATITVTTNDGGKTAGCLVTVIKPETAGSGETITITDTPASITIPEGATGTSLNVTPGAALPQVEINAASDLGSVQVQIPAGTAASGSENWDGTFSLPAVTSQASININGASQVNTVVTIGLDDEKISFSKAVRILIPGQAGKSAGYIRNGQFTQITRTISADQQMVADSEIPPDGEGKIDVGSDLVVWTKHFTEFVAYTAVEAPESVSCTVSLRANSDQAGTVSGGGTFISGSFVTVTAIASNGYEFESWTEGGGKVSQDANYSFNLGNQDRSLIANFVQVFPDKMNQPADKPWTIAFSQAINLDDNNRSNIYVATDAYGENRIEGIKMEAVPANSRKLVVRPPDSNWTPGRTYYLIIEPDFQSQAGDKLKTKIRMKFTVECPSSSSIPF